MSADTISRLNREAMGLHQSIQRLTRENHKHLDTLKVVAQDANSMRDALAVAQANIRSMEAEVWSATRETAAERTRRQAAEAALKARSASKIRWGTLALGWCLGAATVLVWAFL